MAASFMSSPQKLKNRGVGEFGRRADAAVYRIIFLRQPLGRALDNVEVDLPTAFSLGHF